MQSKATNSSRLSAYHFVLKTRMTNARQIEHHNSATFKKRADDRRAGASPIRRQARARGKSEDGTATGCGSGSSAVDPQPDRMKTAGLTLLGSLCRCPKLPAFSSPVLAELESVTTGDDTAIDLIHPLCRNLLYLVGHRLFCTNCSG